MKIAKAGVLAATFLAAIPAYAATEFDCSTEQSEAQSQRNEPRMSDDLIQKRRQAREAELARLKERLMRASTANRTTASEQADTRQ